MDQNSSWYTNKRREDKKKWSCGRARGRERWRMRRRHFASWREIGRSGRFKEVSENALEPTSRYCGSKRKKQRVWRRSQKSLSWCQHVTLQRTYFFEWITLFLDRCPLMGDPIFTRNPQEAHPNARQEPVSLTTSVLLALLNPYYF